MNRALPEATAIYFASPADFRAWLAEHHGSVRELWVGFHKRATGRPTLTWPESVDEALCFGWIDGLRQRVDERRYRIRFTPRRAGSIWSAVNLRRAEELIAEGRMRPPGQAAWEKRREDRTRRYSFEQETAGLTPEHERDLRRDRAAWKFWTSQPPGYRKTASWWVESAKREETRRRRLAKLVEHSAAGRRIPPLARPDRSG